MADLQLGDVMTRFPCTVERPCDVCGGIDFALLAPMRTPRIPDLKVPIGICRACGFITQRPRLSPSDYKAVNRLWYVHKFAKDAPTDPDEGKKFRKWARVWDRIAPFYPAGPQCMLDVGAGQGWAIEYLKGKFPDLAAVAIEQWPACQDYIRSNLGAEVVGVDIDSRWPDSLRNRFDLVIFRHTLEHLEEPLEALHQIALCLADAGHAYLAVPNALRVKPDRPVSTDFFRPVHLHYFNRHTLTALARRAGLVPTVLDDAGEIWGLFRRGQPQELTGDAVCNDSYLEQKQFIEIRLEGARTLDRRRVLAIELNRFFAQMFGGRTVA